MSGDISEVVKSREGVTISMGLLKMFEAGYLGKKNKKAIIVTTVKTANEMGPIRKSISSLVIRQKSSALTTLLFAPCC